MRQSTHINEELSRQKLLDLSPDAVLILELFSERILFCNQSIHSLLGYAPSELISMGGDVLPTIITSNDSKRIRSKVIPRFATLKDDVLLDDELVFRHKAGNSCTLRSRAKVFERDKSGYVKSVVLTLSNATDGCSTSCEKDAYIEYTREFIQYLPFGTALVDSNRRVKLMNKAALSMTGFSEDEIIDRKCSATFCTNDCEICPVIDELSVMEQREKRVSRKDGSLIPVLKSAVPVKFNNAYLLLEAFVDISMLKEAEAQRRQSEEKLHAAVAASNLAMFDWDVNTNEVVFDDNYFIQAGYEPREFPYNFQGWADRVHPSDFIWLEQRVKDFLSGKLSAYDELFRFKRKDGSWMWIRAQASIVERNADQSPSRVIGTHLDMTRYKEIEKQASESEERLSALFDSNLIGNLHCSIKGDLYSANDKFLDMIGYSRDEFEEKSFTWLDLLENKEAKQLLPGNIEARDKGFCEPFELRLKRKDGSFIWALIGYVLLYEDREEAMLLAIDITDRKKASAEIEKMNVELTRSNQDLEQFAYVASHDLQEPLRKMRNYSELLEYRYRELLDDKGKKYLDIISSGASRMQTLIDDLLLLSRINSRGNAFEEVDMMAVVKHVEDLLEVPIRQKNAKIIYEDLPVITGDRGQMKLLMQNLVSNALKFTNHAPPEIILSTEESETNWIIRIRDNGIGIDMKYAGRIFEVFQRLHTREEYKGTGIGLAICRKIAERHKGRIWVESGKGKGSTFFISLPKEIRK